MTTPLLPNSWDELRERLGPLDALGRLRALRAHQLDCWNAGNAVPVEAYLHAFPEVADDEQLALDLIYAEYCLRQQRGERPRQEDYLRRFPERADSLARQLLVSEQMNSAADSLTASPPRAGESCLGQRGHFRLLREIGHGGMGVVYEAEDLNLSRRVALKLLPSSHLADPRRLQRFEKEAKAAALLDHPHIVPVYEVNRADGMPYFAMKFIEGRDLAQVIAALRGTPEPSAATNLPAAASALSRADTLDFAAGPAPAHQPPGPEHFRAAATWTAQAADALHYAHEQGVIHRDIKPGNLLLDGDGKLWVVDFGLARLGPGDGLTGSGDLLGTPRYLSPEQASGRNADIDRRADVYALGVTLYELLTLRPAFSGKDTLETLRRILHDEAVQPRRLDARIPVELETIVRKAMSRDPGDRYATAKLLAEDLRLFLDDRPIRGRLRGWLTRSLRWCQREPWRVAAGGMVALVGGLLTVMLSWPTPTPPPPPSEVPVKARTVDPRLQEYANNFPVAAALWENGQLGSLHNALNAIAPRHDDLDARGFEWHYLRHRELIDGRAHHGEFVVAVASADEGRQWISVGERGSVKCWDATTLKFLREFSLGHKVKQERVKFSNDAARLVTTEHVDQLETVRLWDVATGKKLAESTWSVGQVRCLALSAEGDRVALGGNSLSVHGPMSIIHLWAPGEKLSKRSIRLPEDKMAWLRFSPNGRHLACRLESSRQVRLLEVDSIGVIEDWRTSSTVLGTQVYSGERAVFSPDSRTLVATDGNVSKILAWDVRTRTERWSVNLPGEEPSALAFPPDGLTVGCLVTPRIGSHAQHRLCLLDTETGRLRAVYEVPIYNVSIAFSPDGEQCAVSDQNSICRLRLPRRHLFGHVPFEAWGVAFSPDGTLATCGDDSTIRLWNTRTGEQPASLRSALGLLFAVAWSPDGRTIATGDYKGKVRLWAAQDGKVLKVLEAHEKSSRALLFSPDGKYLVTAGDDARVRIWDLPSGTLLRTLEGHPYKVSCLALAPDGTTLVGGGRADRLTVWNPSTGALLRTIKAVDGIGAVAYSPDGRTLAVGSGRLIYFRDAATDSVVFTPQTGHTGTIRCLAFSPDGKTLASGGEDRSVRLWHTSTGKGLLSFDSLPQQVNGLAFSPDGETLAAVLMNGMVQLWHASAKP